MVRGILRLRFAASTAPPWLAPALVAAPVAALVTIVPLLAGCGGGWGDRATAPTRTLVMADFSRPAAAQRGGARADDPPTFYGERPVLDEGEVAAEAEAAPEASPKPAPSLKPAPPNPSRRLPEQNPPTASDASPRWVVDGLLGQINGRPVFANEFLLPLEARLQELAASPDRVGARNAMIRLVRERFEDFVNSELIISEAESQLTPEQQQGLFAWLRTIREGEIAARGGTRADAQSSLEEELGMDIDEFLRMRRDQALAATLLQRRVEPRTIVSSRDVEREFARREAEFNPPPVVRIGRLRIPDREAERLERAKSLFDGGASFSQVAEALEVPEGGEWRRLEIAGDVPLADALRANKDLAEPILAALASSDIDRPTPPTVVGGATIWYAVLGVDRPPARSLYDVDVQRQLHAELRARRSAIEQGRYIGQLRTRWISEDISRIEARLVEVALARYWRP
jgi:hypothetical protein